MDETGNVRMGYNPEIGNAIPAYVYYGLTIRWTVPSPVNGKTGNQILSYIKPLLKRVLAGLSVEWDGNNNIGLLTDSAQTAAEKIQEELDSYNFNGCENCGFYDPEYVEWCENQ
jgi:hypothetical protein